MTDDKLIIHKAGNTWSDYKCKDCDTIYTVDMEDEVFMDRTKCPNCGDCVCVHEWDIFKGHYMASDLTERMVVVCRKCLDILPGTFETRNEVKIAVEKAGGKLIKSKYEGALVVVKKENELLKNYKKSSNAMEIAVRTHTHFTGEPPYVGDEGLVLAIKEAGYSHEIVQKLRKARNEFQLGEIWAKIIKGEKDGNKV